MVQSESATVPKPPKRKDGRRPLLVYLDPALIKKLKRLALDRDQNVYEVVEAMLLTSTQANDQ
jgi:hypothetical protein